MSHNQTPIEKARSFEKDHQIHRDALPSFHFTAPIGWINDPNGFSWFGDKAHLFAQYHPYSNTWGPMHWTHQTSKDFIKWEQEGTALAPDQPYDVKGCFSGSAIEEDGKHILMYTGVSEKDGQEYQQQCLAIGDGKNYEKPEWNPVIGTDLIPEGFSKKDFRDPKIWKEGDTFYAVMGSLNEKQWGQAVVFSSKNLKDWEFECVMADSEGTFGSMWECPDFFELNGTPILIFSPQDMNAQGYEFHNGHNSVWLTGPYENHHFHDYHARQLDYGLDFYAPQTMLHPDGRRIMTAWMASWDNPIMEKKFRWAGQMTLPRELSLENGKLRQRPVREIEKYRTDAVIMPDTEINGSFSDHNIRGRHAELIIRFKETDFENFTLRMAKDSAGQYETLFKWDKRQNMLEFDRTWAGLGRDANAIRRVKAPHRGIEEIRVILDSHSIEIFINDGEMVLSNAIPTPIRADQIVFECTGKAKADIEFYTIDASR